jgi:hypothetical protein
LARIWDNVPEWIEVSNHGRLWQRLHKKRETKRVCLAQSEQHHHLIQCLAAETAHLADVCTITMNI